MNIARSIFRLLLGKRLPINSGILKVSGISKPVSIRRDHFGIAYIEAESDVDAWYGLGFCHGQDRAFQLEGLLRVVRGTLAELIGPDVLPLDRLSRRIGFHHAAKQQLAILDDEVACILDAYAQGVTAGASIGCRRSAHEFTLLRTKPSAFSAADTLGVLKLMSFNLASNWDSELARLKILTEDGPEALAALNPTYPEWLPTSVPPCTLAGEAIDRLVDDLAVFTATVSPGGGSNNWSIAPSRTAAGRPILANDPHLASVLPPYWYLAHIRTPAWSVAGASFVGAPTFPAGHNGTAAWGITAGLVDNTDLFIEAIGPDGRSIREGDQYVPCETRLETIQVKGCESIREEVLITSRGPVVGPAFEGEVGVLSMRATWLDALPVKGLIQIHHARSFEEFRNICEQWPALPLNMAYADEAGHIGWQLMGQAPQRRRGSGAIPLPGWDPEVGWKDDPLPFDEMPHVMDPETGFVATANNKPTPEGEGPFLGVDWIDGYRLARIVEALEARQDWDLEGVQRLQVDQKSLPWDEMKDIVLALPADSGELRQALYLLNEWDGILAIDAPAAGLYQFFLAEMARRIAEAKAPRATQWALGKGFTPLIPHSMFTVRRTGHLVRLLRKQPDGWFEQGWTRELADALSAAVKRLQQQHGEYPVQWAWGVIRPLTLRHSVGDQAPLDRIFNLGPFPWGGDGNTVGQASSPPDDPTANPLFIASLRMVVDVGNWDENQFVLPGGQSGNPLSPHYDDQLPLWQQGKGVPIHWSPGKIEEATQTILNLKPE